MKSTVVGFHPAKSPKKTRPGSLARSLAGSLTILADYMRG